MSVFKITYGGSTQDEAQGEDALSEAASAAVASLGSVTSAHIDQETPAGSGSRAYIDVVLVGDDDELPLSAAEQLAAVFDVDIVEGEKIDTCQWFANCTNEATTSVKHPVLGAVAACERCQALATA